MSVDKYLDKLEVLIYTFIYNIFLYIVKIISYIL
jgi:hypothetical protein